MSCNDKDYFYNYRSKSCQPTLENICKYGYYLNIVGKPDCQRQPPACNFTPIKLQTANKCFALCKDNDLCGISYWDPKTKLCNQLPSNYQDENCKNCGWHNFNVYGICNKKDNIVSLDYIKPEIINSVNDFGVCDKIDCKNGECNGYNTCKCNKGYYGKNCSLKL
jgi:hypothetical protein